MKDRIQFLDGLIDMNPALAVCAVGILALFLFSYLCEIRRTRRIMDVFHFTVFIKLLVPLVIFYAGAGSFWNIQAMGVENGLVILTKADAAATISFAGILCVFIGRWIALVRSKSRIHFSVDRLATSLTNKIYENINSLPAIWGLIGMALAMFALLVGLVGVDAFLSFQARAAFAHYGGGGLLRPVFNFIFGTLTPLLVPLLFARFLDRKQIGMLTACGIIFGLSFASGTRAAALGPVLVCFLIWSMKRNNVWSLFLSVLGGVVLVCVAVLLGMVRRGVYDFGDFGTIVLEKLLIGNEFSDLRDFGWTLLYWDGNHFFGKSYLGALLAFLPSALFPLKNNYMIVWLTTGPTGLMATGQHPGLRIGFFGESYYNFGWVGVAIVGMLFGYLLTVISRAVVRELQNKAIDVGVYTLAAYTLIGVVIAFGWTAGFYRVYSLLALLMFTFFLRKLFGKRNPKRFRLPMRSARPGVGS